MRLLITIALIAIAITSSAQNMKNIGSKYNDAIKFIGNKDYSTAKLLLDEIIKQKPDYAEAVFARGTCYLMLEERLKSCDDFNKASALNWKPADEYINKFCNKESLKRYTKEEK